MISDSADEALAKDVVTFAEMVDRIRATVEEARKNGKTPPAPSGQVLIFKKTPLVLQMLGADAISGKSAGQRELHVSPHTFRNIIEGHHGITFEMLKQIPEAMVDPIMIFDSASGKARGDVVFMLELKDTTGATIVTPVALETIDENHNVINIVKSAYAKENDGYPNNEWFKNQAVRGENTRYYNREKLERWQLASGVQFPVRELRNAHGNTIYTKDDLVKLQETSCRANSLEKAAITPKTRGMSR